MMYHIRTHADHIDIHIAIKQDIIYKIFFGLPRQTNHNTCTHLETYAAQAT